MNPGFSFAYRKKVMCVIKLEWFEIQPSGCIAWAYGHICVKSYSRMKS